jgi:hypothetical protein
MTTYFIYQITCNITNECYYGSTCQIIKERIRGHKKDRDCASVHILDRNDYKVDILETLENCSKLQAEQRESYYQRNFDCINKNIARRTQKEYREDNRESRKKQQKEYRELNREKLKEYYEVNRDSILQKKNKKYTCECGSIIRKGGKSRHEKTKKHQEFLKK